MMSGILKGKQQCSLVLQRIPMPKSTENALEPPPPPQLIFI